jgi:hypothetical protein
MASLTHASTTPSLETLHQQLSALHKTFLDETASVKRGRVQLQMKLDELKSNNTQLQQRLKALEARSATEDNDGGDLTVTPPPNRQPVGITITVGLRTARNTASQPLQPREQSGLTKVGVRSEPETAVERGSPTQPRQQENVQLQTAARTVKGQRHIVPPPTGPRKVAASHCYGKRKREQS